MMTSQRTGGSGHPAGRHLRQGVIERGKLDAQDAYSATDQHVWGLYLDEQLVYDHDADGDGDFDDIGGSDKRYYVVHDFLYSASAVIDPSAAVLERYDYEPYGKPTRWNASYTGHLSLATGHCSFLFTGQMFDAETGLHHFKRRAVHSGLGRFCQRDPKRYAEGSDLLEYASSAPHCRHDPTGAGPSKETREVYAGVVSALQTWSWALKGAEAQGGGFRDRALGYCGQMHYGDILAEGVGDIGKLIMKAPLIARNLLEKFAQEAFRLAKDKIRDQLENTGKVKGGSDRDFNSDECGCDVMVAVDTKRARFVGYVHGRIGKNEGDAGGGGLDQCCPPFEDFVYTFSGSYTARSMLGYTYRVDMPQGALNIDEHNRFGEGEEGPDGEVD